MYTNVPNLVIGFHGCDKTVAEKVINGEAELDESKNNYDWLGHGMYFWEQNLRRAWQWAENQRKVTTPAVIGAVIDLGYCLNLLDSRSMELLREHYSLFVESCDALGKVLPQNRNIGKNTDLLLRDLDCAIIEDMHKLRDASPLPSFDSVRGVFIEGTELYQGSGFKDKSHIQICVRNPNCIKGFFLPRNANTQWSIP
ncbi:MAG: hypothetical protein IJH37_09905 [Clostridia bacterium]|nr:hypothetical protein [Clostridia bacterium]